MRTASDMTPPTDTGRGSFRRCGCRQNLDAFNLDAFEETKQFFRTAILMVIKSITHYLLGCPFTLCRSRPRFCSTVMDIVRGEHRDAAVAVLGVVPGEECPAEGNGRREVGEATGEAGMVLHGFELRLGERVVIGHLGTAQRAGYAEISEKLRGTLARHRRATIGVQGQHLGLDALLVTGLLDEAPGQRRVLPVSDHPAHDVAAEDIEQHVEVEVRPLLRPEQLGDTQDQVWFGPVATSSGRAVEGESSRVTIRQAKWNRLRRASG